MSSVKIILAMTVAGFILASCGGGAPATTPTEALAIPSTRTLSTEETINSTAPGKDPQNATYLIEGDAVTLVNGVAEKVSAPGVVSKQVTRYFGNEVELDLNSDGLLDSAFLLDQDRGGSGVFYYAAATLKTADGCVGTNAILLGEGISPQTIMIDPDNPSRFIVSYGEKPAAGSGPSEPMLMASVIFRIENGLLVEVVPPLPTQTP